MKFSELAAFHAVAKEGGFTRAAKARNIAQPSLSRHIRTLEDRYRVELFYRRGSTISLSALGRQLFDISNRIFVQVDEAEQLLKNTGGVMEGHLRIGTVESHELTKVVAAFKRRYPAIELSVFIANSRELLTELVDFRIDIAFLAQPEEDPRLSTVACGRHPVVIFVNRNHPWADRTDIGIDELEDQEIVMRESGSMTRHAFERALAARGIHIRKLLEMGSRDMVWWTVIHGAGIGFVSKRDFIPHPDLVAIDIRDQDIHYDLKAACLTGRRNAPLIQPFFETLEGVLAEDAPMAAA